MSRFDGGRGFRLAEEFDLMSWDEVKDEYNRISGESLSRSMIWKVAQGAIKKLRAALEQEAADRDLI